MAELSREVRQVFQLPAVHSGAAFEQRLNNINADGKENGITNLFNYLRD